MSQPPPRRFPPVSGPYGWAGAGFLVAALASQIAVAIFLVWLVVNRDRRVVIPLIICFFLGFPLLGAALAIWRIGLKRGGTLRPSSVARSANDNFFGTLAVMNLASALGVGGFVYLALRLDGTRRFAFAIVPLLLSVVVSNLGLLKLRQLQNRPAPSILGLAPERQTILLIGFSLIGSAFLIVAGLFWIPP